MGTASTSEKNESVVLQRTQTQSDGEVYDLNLDPLRENNKLRRNFTPGHIHMISLGSNIGGGIFVAIGKVLAKSGPGSMLIGYAYVGTLVAAILQTMAEMTIAFPVSGNFINYIDRWVDPALAFAAGFAEWIGWTAVVSVEATYFGVIMNYWLENKVPLAAWLTIFLVILGGLFFLPNKWFAWFEYWCSVLKVSSLIIIFITSIALICGAGPTGQVHNGETWRDFPVFTNGFKGFSNAMLFALFMMGDQVFTGIMAGEAQSPRFSVAHATKLVPLRVFFTYILTITFVSLLVTQTDPRLFGGRGVNASPYAIAFVEAGIPGMAHFLNIVILSAVATLAAESIYIPSRILRTMGEQGLVSKFLAKVDSEGRPRWSLAITFCLAILLTYINLSSTGIIVFDWMVNITSSAYFTVWGIMSFTSYRFHKAIELQKDGLFQEPYAYKAWRWPLPTLYLFIGSVFLFAVCFYIGLSPIGVDGFSVYSFFEYMLGFLLIFTSYLGYKLVYKTKLRDLQHVDLKSGRRTLDITEISFLDEYYSQPTWRRLLGYLKVW